MQIIINSVYISSDDVNGWTQALARSFPRRSRAEQSMRRGFWWWCDDEKRARVCTKNDEQCLIYAFSIWQNGERWKNFSSGPINSVCSSVNLKWALECIKNVQYISGGIENFDHFIYYSMNRTIRHDGQPRSIRRCHGLWSIQIMMIKLTNKVMFQFVISIHYIRQPSAHTHNCLSSMLKNLLFIEFCFAKFAQITDIHLLRWWVNSIIEHTKEWQPSVQSICLQLNKAQ